MGQKIKTTKIKYTGNDDCRQEVVIREEGGRCKVLFRYESKGHGMQGNNRYDIDMPLGFADSFMRLLAQNSVDFKKSVLIEE